MLPFQLLLFSACSKQLHSLPLHTRLTLVLRITFPATQVQVMDTITEQTGFEPCGLLARGVFETFLSVNQCALGDKFNLPHMQNDWLSCRHARSWQYFQHWHVCTKQCANRRQRVMKNCLVYFRITASHQYHNASCHNTAKSWGLENCEPRCMTMQGLHCATKKLHFTYL